MVKRSYGSGRLFVRVDVNGREAWYGSWWAGGVRVKRKIGPKRRAGTSDGLTRTQAEAELRRRILTEVVLAGAQRRTVAEAGGAYVDHLEHVMERKRTTIQDYRGYLRKHLAPFFGSRALDKIDRARVAAYLKAKKLEGLSAKTVQNHLNFLHGIFAFAVKREWATSNPVALVDRPKAPRCAHRRLRFLSKEELELVLRAAPDAIERPLYLTAAMTGLRQGELLALRWSDVDWVARSTGCVTPSGRGWPPPGHHCAPSRPGWAHADASTTEIYAHYAPDPSGEAAFAERAFASGSAEGTSPPAELHGVLAHPAR